MIDIFKIVGIGMAGGIMSMFLKNYRQEYAVLCGLLTALTILLLTANTLAVVISDFTLLADKTDIKYEYIEVVIKTIGIAYIAEFASQVLKDAGEGSVASKIELAGKAAILYITFPIITDFLEVCINAVNSI